MNSLVRQATVSVLSVELLCALTFAGASLWHEWKVRQAAVDLILQGRSDSLIGAVQDAEDPQDNRLRDASEAERRFLSDAAHELKTAVAVAKSSLQVLGMRSRSAEEYRGGLHRVLDDNQRVEDLVSRMLSLARSSEETTAAADDIDIGESIRTALGEISSYAEAKNVSIEASLEPDVRAHIAPGEVTTIISNLVINAIQHSNAGSSVRIAAQAIGAKIHVTVQDFGTGISTDSLPHVFDRFFREDASRSRDTGGAGLGLSICKAIVEKARGSIEIESQVGRGTIVKVWLSKSPAPVDNSPVQR